MSDLVTIAPPAEKPRFNYSQNAFEGGKYKETQHLGVTEIAKILRKELKEKFPGFKFGIRCQKFAGGCSIDVSVKQWPTNFNPWSEYYRNIDLCRKECMRSINYTHTLNEDGDAILKEIEKVANQYNFDDSESQTDYFHVSFYLHVRNDVSHPLDLIGRYDMVDDMNRQTLPY